MWVDLEGLGKELYFYSWMRWKMIRKFEWRGEKLSYLLFNRATVDPQ